MDDHWVDVVLSRADGRSGLKVHLFEPIAVNDVLYSPEVRNFFGINEAACWAVITNGARSRRGEEGEGNHRSS